MRGNQSGVPGNTAPAQDGSSSQPSPIAINAAQRATFIQNSMLVRKTLPVVTGAVNQTTYSIPLNNQGALLGVDLEFNIALTAAGSGTPQNGAPYNLISNINFVDQSNITRHSLSGLGLVDYLIHRGNAAAPWGMQAALSTNSPSHEQETFADPVVPNLAAGTVNVKFWMHLPIAKSRMNTTGMVLLQTGNQNQPAVVNITLTPKIAAQGDSPYNLAFTYAAGTTITAHQVYYQPQAGAVAPQIDTQVQWALTETGADTTNLTVGQIKQILFQTQFPTSLVGIRYFNGTAYGGIPDLTSILLKTLGGTFIVNDDSPTMFQRRAIVRKGFPNFPGLYWFDFAAAPIQYASVGVYEADLTPAVVNAGAYTTQLYDWLKLPAQLATLPGAAQL